MGQRRACGTSGGRSVNDKTAAEALAAYESLYKNPHTGELIIDTDEAQVAADLADVVRSRLDADQRTEHDRLVAERAWDEGFTRGFYAGQAYPDGTDASEPDIDNPYRKEQENNNA